jgi:hypothetical protein
MRQYLRPLEKDFDSELQRALEEMKNPKTKQLEQTRFYLSNGQLKRRQTYLNFGSVRPALPGGSTRLVLARNL